MQQALPPLVKDISVTLTAAGSIVMLSQLLGLPLVVAYIFAGLCLGSSSYFLFEVSSPEQIRILSELGLLFLLFGLGLEFSFRKLIKLGASVLFIGALEVLLSVYLGFHIGQLVHLPASAAVIIGFIISISSTGVIVKIFQEKKELSFHFAETVIGVLIVEDLFAVIFLLLITVLKQPSWAALSEQVGSVFAVSTLWLLFGTVLVPMFVKRLKPVMTDEVILISSLGFCLATVLFAGEIGFSTALAAFLCGSVLAETSELHRIELITRPVRNLFAAIFFVSIGMLLDFQLVSEHWKLTLLIVSVVLASKAIFVTLSCLLAGRSTEDSIKSALSMIQIGEFSIVIASISCGKKILPEEWQAIIVSASVILILITSLVSQSRTKLSRNIIKSIPRFIVSLLERYRYSLLHIERASASKVIITKIFQRVLLNCTIVLAIFLFTKLYIIDNSQEAQWCELLYLLGASIVAAPFLFSLSRLGDFVLDQANKSALVRPRRRIMLPQVISITSTLLFYMAISLILLPDIKSLAPITAVVMILMYFFSAHLKKANIWVFGKLQSSPEIQFTSAIAAGPWDEHLHAISVHPLSVVVDKTLRDLDLRHKYRINVILHQRGTRRTVAPDAEIRLMPQDIILVLGGDEDVQRLEFLFSSSSEVEYAEEIQSGFTLTSVEVESGSIWCGRALKELDVGHTLRAVIVAIERQENRIVSPDGEQVIKANDYLWLAMEKSRAELLDMFCKHIPDGKDSN